jgi:DNA-directed RNA polymerase specialized sigma24 family protein
VTVLYGPRYRALTRLAALLAGDVAVAEEIVQAAFAALHGAGRRMGDGGTASSYLLRAVVSRARSHGVPRPGPPSRQQVLAQAGQPASIAPEALLLAALRSLPARQREGLVLRCYAGLPGTQIASVMGISTRAVSSHIRRGMSFI